MNARRRQERAAKKAEHVLGPGGRMISASKTHYRDRYPDHVAVFNANLCLGKPAAKIWYGDLDLTLDQGLLVELARALGEPLYVLYERDARFRNELTPLLDQAVAVVDASGITSHDLSIVRSNDGALTWKKTSQKPR